MIAKSNENVWVVQYAYMFIIFWVSIGRVLGISEMFDTQLFKNMPKLNNE